MGFKSYYTDSRPATAKTFYDSCNLQRKIRLLALEMLEDRTPRDGGYVSFVARVPVNHVLRRFVREWRIVTRARRRHRAIASRCFDAWAWHPDGALMRTTAARFWATANSAREDGLSGGAGRWRQL